MDAWTADLGGPRTADLLNRQDNAAAWGTLAEPIAYSDCSSRALSSTSASTLGRPVSLQALLNRWPTRVSSASPCS